MSDYTQLPTVSFVCPSLDNSMHNGSSTAVAIHNGDQWLQQHLDGYRGPLSVRQFAGGQSNPTFYLTEG